MASERTHHSQKERHHRRHRDADPDTAVVRKTRKTSHGRRAVSDESASQTSQINQVFLDSIEKVIDKYGNINSRQEINVSACQAIVPEFNPLHDNITTWLHAIDEYAVIYNWSDRVICHLALSKLRGPANVWYQGLPTRIFTWPEWKAMLLENFAPKHDLTTAMTLMLQCKPKSSRDLYAYVFEKLALIYKMKIPLSNIDKVNLIMGGIDDPQIKFSVEAAGIVDPAILAKHFKNAQFNDFKQPSQSSKAKMTDSNALVGPKCYYCKHRGHLQRNCPNMTNKDTQLVPYTKANVRYTSLKQQHINKRFYKYITIENKPFKCYIDFGSECSLITPEAVKTLNLQPILQNNSLQLKTIRGTEDGLICNSYVTTRVIIDDVERIISLYILDSLAIDAHLLIGQNFTELDDIEYSRSGQLLLFKSIKHINTSLREVQNIDDKTVNIGTEDPEKRTKIVDLLNEYKGCIAQSAYDVGYTRLTEMKIALITNKPIAFRPRRYSESEREIIRDIVDELLEKGIVRESNSPYASPVLLVAKKNGEKRLCVDYRALNNITEKDKYPLPIIEEQINRLSGFKYFCSLDLASGYHQIKMSPESVPFTAFITQDGHYEFLRVPFGLCNAPSVFSRMINAALGKLRFTKVLIYLDDILIPGTTITDTLQTLRETLDILQKHGLTLKLSKCFFLETTIEFLGYEISNSTIRPTDNKIEAVKQFPQPTDIHKVRQFLGLTGYFRKFIHQYAMKSRPLSILLHKNYPWEWGESQINAFNILKNYLVSKPILTIFDKTLKTVLYTDASRIGLAGVLVQVHNNREHPVAYFSRQTTAAEKNYHSFSLETLAIIESVKRFRCLLYGRFFTIITDCAAVKSTFTKSEVNTRIGRWVMFLNEFDYEIKHRNNTRMRHVDALSRNPIITNKSVLSITITESDWLLTAQQHDADIQEIKRVLQTGEKHLNKQLFNNYSLKGGIVYKITDNGMRWVVPKLARFQILRICHDDVGHFGFSKTYELLASKYWFVHMRRFVSKYINNCLNCLYFKTPAGKKPGYLHPISKLPEPFHTIHIDHLGPFIKTRNGNTQLIVIVDAFTKFLVIYPVENTRTKYVIDCLKDLFKTFGVPRRIISDQGRAYTSSSFKNFIKEIGATHHLNAVGLPRGNGQVERYNRTLLDSLATMGANMNDDQWDENVANIQVGINSTVNKAIGVSPSEALMGFRVRVNSAMEINELTPVDVTKIRHDILTKVQSDQQKQKQYFDTKRFAAPIYKIGDLVMLKITSTSATGNSQKLVAKWRGPFRVSRVLENDRYEVRDIKGMQRSQIPYCGIAGIENMKPWIHFIDDD